MSDKALETRGKEEIQSQAESTRPGPVFSPAVDIFETEEGITLLADMPGVASKDVDIDLKEGVLTVTGEAGHGLKENENPLLNEYETGRYERSFTISDRIDQSKISAAMSDGVLRLFLPKAEKAKPRKIEVMAD